MTPSPSGTAAPFDPRSLYSSNNTNSTSTPAKPPQASSSNGSASVKREQGASIADDAGNSPSSGGKKKPSKRRKVNLACIYCRRSHMTCDEGRPCQRCIKRDIGHLCHDEATPAKANEPHEAPASSTPSKPRTHASASTAKPATEVASTSAPTTSATLGAVTALASTDTNNFFPTLGVQPAAPASSASSNSASAAAFSGGSAGPYSSVSPLSSLNQNNDFNPAAIFKPQASAAASVGSLAMQPSTSSGASGDMAANNMLSLASLFQNSINGSTPNPNSVSTSLAAPTQSVGAPAPNQDMSGLGGAGWLGLGGGPGGYEGGGSGFGGDSAGGNEFTLLSEFLESLDGPGFGAGATPGMTAAGASGSGLTPSQSRRNTISGLAPSSGVGAFDGLTALTPINNSETSAHARASLPTMPSASAPGMYDSGSASIGGTAGFGTYASGNNSANQGDAAGGKRSRRSSYSAAATSSSGAAGAAPSSVAASGSYIPSLQGGSTKTERFFLTAADQKDGTRDERLARVIQAKYEAGLLRPYNHVNGYARLNRWMERNVSAASKRRILKPLSVFRPAFRAVAQSLTNIDLVFIEEAFERLLLDYDRVFSTQGIPACLWRRTGEIYKGNKEFAELVGVPIESLREGRLCIYELMAEESAVNYWEKYGAVSFDPGQKAVLTSCVLRTKNKAIVAGGTSGKAANAIAAQLPRSATASGQITPVAQEQQPPGAAAGTVAAGTGATSTSGVLKDPNNPKAAFIHCCFSFTIRRDQWNIPHMIVGNFLPTNPP